MEAPAKLTAPALARVHPRTRLYRRLDEQRDCPVIWITAPAGAGKTTLVAAYLAARRIRPLWYRLDAGDGDPASFFHYLGEGLKRRNGARRRMLPVLAPEYQNGLAAFSRDFFRRLFAAMKPPGVLVLDDMETLHDHAPFQEILRHGLAEIPPGRQVIVASRRPPPPSLRRAQLTGRLHCLDGADLRLTPEETRGIVRLLSDSQPVSEATLASLEATASGWVTGLVLQLQHAPDPPTDPDPHAPFAAYFAHEVFRHLPEKTRTLLLETAWLCPVRPGDAARLTGLRDAGRRLAWLARRQLFVTRLAGSRTAYAYHPLLRSFLQAQAEQRLTPAEQRALKRATGHCLAAAGETERAARLFQDTAHWDALADLIRHHARALLAQGRHHTLHRWLQALPRPHLEGDAWLRYWAGCATLAFDPHAAGAHFRAAHPRFLAEGDGAGAYLAWLGVMDGLMYANDSLADVPRWLEALDQLRARFGPAPDPEIEGRVAFTAFNMGFTACPERRSASQWGDEAERLRRLLPAIPDDTARCLAAASLAMCFTWHPQPARLRLLADTLQPQAEDERIAPLARVIAHLVEITRRWTTGETAGTPALIDRALALTDRHGIEVGRPWLLSAAIIYHLTQQDADRAADLLSRYRRHIQAGHRHEQAHYHYLAGWLAWLRRDPALACEHTARAHADLQGLHTPHFQLLSGCAHAFMLIETGRPDHAQTLIDATRQLAIRCHSRHVAEFHLGLLEAWRAWRQGEMETALAHLRPALACGRELDLQVTLWHLPTVLARLCALALAQRIETDYVARLIRRNALPRPPGTETLAPWPVAVRIHSLGRFAVQCEDRPLDTADRAHRKPLKLLKVLVALGGRAVPAERIEDILWPEAEGGDARRALITTLQRLRRLLGARERIRFDDGRLSLDPEQTWLDTWALKAGLDADTPQALDQALGLYGGPLLAEEGEAPWLLSARLHLHDDVLQGYERLGRRLAEAGAWRDLIPLYRRALKIDDLHEPFYRGLMEAHARLGQQAQAARLYHRCRRRLRDALDLPPSPATQALFRSLTPR